LTLAILKKFVFVSIRSHSHQEESKKIVFTKETETRPQQIDGRRLISISLAVAEAYVVDGCVRGK
jgi:hypothetical protein